MQTCSTKTNTTTRMSVWEGSNIRVMSVYKKPLSRCIEQQQQQQQRMSPEWSWWRITHLYICWDSSYSHVFPVKTNHCIRHTLKWFPIKAMHAHHQNMTKMTYDGPLLNRTVLSESVCVYLSMTRLNLRILDLNGYSFKCILSLDSQVALWCLYLPQHFLFLFWSSD